MALSKKEIVFIDLARTCGLWLPFGCRKRGPWKSGRERWTEWSWSLTHRNPEGGREKATSCYQGLSPSWPGRVLQIPCGMLRRGSPSDPCLSRSVEHPHGHHRRLHVQWGTVLGKGGRRAERRFYIAARVSADAEFMLFNDSTVRSQSPSIMQGYFYLGDWIFRSCDVSLSC